MARRHGFPVNVPPLQQRHMQHSTFARLSTMSFTLVLGASAAAQFGPGQVLPIGIMSSVEPVDLDGDGDLDILGLTIGASGHLRTMENLGFGEFGPSQPLPGIGTIPNGQFVLVDLDGDLQRDLVVLDPAGFITWMQGQGGASFAAAQPIGTTSFPVSIAVDDLDRDGDMDIAVVRSIGLLVWFENDGNEVFALASLIPSLLGGPRRVRTADLNNDTHPDILLVSGNDDKVSWHENLGNGAFGPQQVITTGADNALDAVAADLDGDGLLDVVSASRGDTEIAWNKNNGGGSFGPQQILDTAASGLQSVIAADVDLDGDLDIIAGGGPVRWIENLGFGFFGVPQLLPGPSGGVKVLVVADIDGDSDMDILSGARALYPGEFPVSTTYCTSTANSTGDVSALAATGSTRVSYNAVALTATDLSPSSFGFFLASMTSGVVNQPAGSQGVLCLGGAIGRYVGPGQILFSGALRRFRLTLDLDVTPSPTGLVQVTAGQTWFFQAWHRDSVGGQPTSNFTDAVQMNFN